MTVGSPPTNEDDQEEDEEDGDAHDGGEEAHLTARRRLCRRRGGLVQLGQRKNKLKLNFHYGSRADHGKNILYIINPYFLRAKLLIMVRQVRVRKGERILGVGFLCTVYKNEKYEI